MSCMTISVYVYDEDKETFITDDINELSVFDII